MNTGAKKKFVFAATTALQAGDLLELGTSLVDRGHSVTYLDIGTLYNQRAASVFESNGVPYGSLPTSGETPEWCALSHDERKPYFAALLSWAWEYFSDPFIDSLLVGNDVGDIEQLCLRSAERFGIHTARIQDGAQGLRAEQLRKPHETEPILYPPMPMEGGCDQYFVWTKELANIFQKRALPGRCAVTGSLRHDKFYGAPKYEGQRNSGEMVIGIAGQPFSHYGDMWESQEIGAYEHIVQACLSRTDAKVIFRPHPESTLRETYQDVFSHLSNRVTVESDTPLIEFLLSIDCLVTISSSVASDATALGIPAYQVRYLRSPEHTEDIEKDIRHFRSYLTNPLFPYKEKSTGREHLFFRSVENPSSFSNSYIGEVTGEAKEEILRGLTEPSTREDQMSRAPVTFLLDSTGEDLTGTLLTVIRDASPTDEIIVIDRSHNGILHQFLREVPAFQNVTSLPYPNRAQADALNECLRSAKHQILLRVASGSHILPGATNKLVELLEQNPNSPAVASSFYGREDSEVSKGAVELPKAIGIETYSTFQTAKMSSYCYMFRKEVLMASGGFKSSDIETLGSLISSTPGGTITSHRAPLFFTPTYYSNESALSFENNLPLYQRRFESKNSEEVRSPGTTIALLTKKLANKEFSSALPMVQNLSESENHNSAVLYLKALIEAKTDHTEQCIETLKRVITLDNSHTDAKALLEYLSSP